MSKVVYEVPCPLDCGEELIVTWWSALSLTPEDVALDHHHDPAEAHSTSWKVECLAGHVLLLPGRLGCPCEDHGQPGCHHDEDDYDWSDDNRNFRAHDTGRLRAVLARFAAVRSGAT